MSITKQIKRKIRVLRLLAVVQAYHYYTMMQMNRQLLHIDNCWKEAEHLSDWMRVLIPYREHSPTDFLHDKNEVTNEVLDNYSEFKKWIAYAKNVGISEKTLMAFCKNVDNLQSVFLLKAFGHIFYPEWLMALYLYLKGSISKIGLQNTFVEYSLFSGKSKPANRAEFIKTILEIEKIISEITIKQVNREVRQQIFGTR